MTYILKAAMADLQNLLEMIWNVGILCHTFLYHIIYIANPIISNLIQEWTSTETLLHPFFFFTFLKVSFSTPVSTGAVLDISHACKLRNCQHVSTSNHSNTHTHFYPARTISSSKIISRPQSPGSVDSANRASETPWVSWSCCLDSVPIWESSVSHRGCSRPQSVLGPCGDGWRCGKPNAINNPPKITISSGINMYKPSPNGGFMALGFQL